MNTSETPGTRPSLRSFPILLQALGSHRNGREIGEPRLTLALAS